MFAPQTAIEWNVLQVRQPSRLTREPATIKRDASQHPRHCKQKQKLHSETSDSCTSCCACHALLPEHSPSTSHFPCLAGAWIRTCDPFSYQARYQSSRQLFTGPLDRV